MSRSELYAKAVSNYIKAQKNEAVTKALDQIYAKGSVVIQRIEIWSAELHETHR